MILGDSDPRSTAPPLSPGAAIDTDWLAWVAWTQEHSLSDPGRERVAQLSDPAHWAQSIAACTEQQARTEEARVSLTDPHGGLSMWGVLRDLPSIEPTLALLAREATLSAVQLGGVRDWMRALEAWSEQARELSPEHCPRLIVQARDTRLALPDLAAWGREWARVLTATSPTEISERATPEIARLYERVRTARHRIRARLEEISRDWAAKGWLQGEFHDLREGRYVLPIKSSHQADAPGAIIDASATKQTVFVEPARVQPESNELRLALHALDAEIERLLRELSHRLAPIAPLLTSSIRALVDWESHLARARVGEVIGARSLRAATARSPEITLQGVAHPLLWRSLPPERIVRNTLTLSGSDRALLITGPNTGGKTVLLKTVGFAARCLRAGYGFPTQGEDGVMPYFEQVLSDVGDPQSIADQVSSFSGHVLEFKRLLESIEHAPEQARATLVLLDELNSATDPEEGAALSRALVETVLECGATLIATTHDPRLKLMASTGEISGLVCGSMEFDDRSKTPRYRLQIGIAGRSRALDTAERLGLSPKLLARARSYLSSQHARMEQALAMLETRLKLENETLEHLHAETERARTEAIALRNQWRERVRAGTEIVIAESRRKARILLERIEAEAREHAAARDSALGAPPGEASPAGGSLDAARASLPRQIEQLDAMLRADAAERDEQTASDDALDSEARSRGSGGPEDAGAALTIGCQVRVPRYKTTGVVLELMSGSRVRVAMGNLKIALPTREVEALAPPLATGNHPRATVNVQVGAFSAEPLNPRLDLRGLRLEEALAQTERYLDQVVAQRSFAQVTIVHGYGSGALREGVKTLLRSLPYVRSSRDGSSIEGSTGATVVELEW